MLTAPTLRSARRYRDGVEPSVERLAGQLSYLLEDHPELRNASPDAIAERLNHDDRFARAREHYPLLSDEAVARKLDEFEARITPAQVTEALGRLR